MLHLCNTVCNIFQLCTELPLNTNKTQNNVVHADYSSTFFPFFFNVCISAFCCFCRQTIKPSDIATVRTLGRPPQLIMQTMDCVLLLLRRRVNPVEINAETNLIMPSWQESLNLMTSGSFLSELEVHFVIFKLFRGFFMPIKHYLDLY